MPFSRNQHHHQSPANAGGVRKGRQLVRILVRRATRGLHQFFRIENSIVIFALAYWLDAIAWWAFNGFKFAL